jgi:natural product biosynthesis luciferase-like monooxygenase protein
MSPSTIIELLAAAAETHPQRIVYSFVTGAGQCLETLTLGDLHARSKALAVRLLATAEPGARALVICNPGLQSIVAFFGCLYAGFIAVPVPPPAKKTQDPRLQAIADDSGAVLVLGALDRQVEALPSALEGMMENILTSDLAEASSELWKCPALDEKSLAFLQYTSGSTGIPKGVMVSHYNLISNAARMHQAFELTADDRSLLWLPMHHDMGLMGGVIQSIYSGFPTTFLAPSNFMNGPLQWLKLIGQTRATLSGGPNFAYDLCARVASPSACQDLDLSSWRVAFNGSEAVRAETLRRFEETFAPYGFRASAFRPCYGLAESTLLVSVNYLDGSTLSLDPKLLKQGHAQRSSDQAGTKQLVSVGCPGANFSVVIVDPERLQACNENHVGEIWCSGPSVTQGYWNRPEETGLAFAARLAPDDGRSYLRTGDLGFISGNELFVTGRLKDLIIIRGHNYYPQDIEATVESSHRSLRRGCGAAIAMDVNGEERLAVIHELTRQGLKDDCAMVIAAVRRAVLEEHQINPYSVVLIRTGTLPKTPSGKVRRGACRDAYLEGSLQVVASNELSGVDWPDAHSVTANGAEPFFHASKDLDRLIQQFSGSSIADLSPEMPISALGMDSLNALDLKIAIECAMGTEVPLSRILGGATIADLRGWVEQASVEMTEKQQFRNARDGNAGNKFPLSPGQRALWFLQQLEPANTSLTIARLFRIHGRLDRPALRTAFNLLLARHPLLRMTVQVRDGEPYHELAGTPAVFMQEHDASGWSEEKLSEHAHEEARIPFDLAAGPVLRIQLYVCSDSEARLLLCVHHIAVDLRSLAFMVEELSSIYKALAEGIPPQLPENSAQYCDYVAWQSSLLSGHVGSRLRKYWHDVLEDPPPALDLAIGQKNVLSGQTGTHRFHLPPDMIRSLKSSGRENSATLHSVLVAAFELLLSRYSGRDEFLLGILSTGRTHWAWKNVIGYFVNPVVLRPRIDRNSGFVEHLRRSREQLLKALDHADYPFAKMVEQFHSARSGHKTPLVQVMCMLQPSTPVAGSDFASIAMGCDGSSFHLGDLRFESMESDFDGNQFELVFAAAESGGQVHAAFHYDSARFTPDAIAGLAADYFTLLENIARSPREPVAWFPMLNQERMYDALVRWNATTQEGMDEVCIHYAIERQVEFDPKRIAVIFECEELSYAELNKRANSLAHRLIRLNVRPEDRVGIYLERCPEMVIAVLGILKAGAAYVPLDPEHPLERVTAVREGARLSMLVTNRLLARRLESGSPCQFVLMDEAQDIPESDSHNVSARVTPDNLAYVMHTSGTSGRPKGVMISHRNVINFFHGMDQKIGSVTGDTLVAVTSLAFDISVLELLWTLSRGCRVVLAGEQAMKVAAPRRQRSLSPLEQLRFSLFYFASSDVGADDDRYQLLVEGAKLADRLGFEAVWTPERHFHPFGGLYPNPAVTSAALATITSRVHLRAGSVVLPLQNPIRIAEEWSLVDNLSHGRAGVAFASGWHADDFVFFPDHYEHRRQVMVEGIETVRRLWRGEKVTARSGSGSSIAVSTYPRPKQAELPVWLTSGGSAETFITAAEINANVLTHLLGQEISDVAERIQLYRSSLQMSDHDPLTRTVTLMLHTYLDETEDRARDKALKPFKQYLQSAFGLTSNLIRSLNLAVDIDRMTEKDRDDLLTYAAERYLHSSGLFGTDKSCLAILENLAEIGVTEVACLIDFGLDVESSIQSIHRIQDLRRRLQRQHYTRPEYSVASQAVRHGATMMQCTPSLLRVMAHDPAIKEVVGSMRALMLGGEPVPAALVREFAQTGVRHTFNMYGPTETTIWSAALELDPSGEEVLIGGAIANTQIYILNNDLMPLPYGITGEVCIAGMGLARGYFQDPALTAERFLPDPFARTAGGRLYRTGDLGRRRADGRIELVGRSDQQVKIRGHRIELGDVEASLNLAPGVRTGVAFKVMREDGDETLNAFLVPEGNAALNLAEVRDFLKSRLPQYMVPNAFHVVSALPLSGNGKIDRKALRVPDTAPSRKPALAALPRSALELQIAEIWKEVLRAEIPSVDDNFFDIGGHSLLMVQVHHRVQHLLGRDFPLIEMLEHPTIRSLACHLEGAPAEEGPASDRVLSRVLEQKDAFLVQRERALAAREEN